jgi:hypothetical protein
VEAALAGVDVDGLVNGILPNALEPEVLQPVLHDADVDIGERPLGEVVLALERLHQHRRAQHLVVGDGVGPHRANTDQGVGQYRQRLRLFAAAADALRQPCTVEIGRAWALALSRLGLCALTAVIVRLGIDDLHVGARR